MLEFRYFHCFFIDMFFSESFNIICRRKKDKYQTIIHIYYMLYFRSAVRNTHALVLEFDSTDRLSKRGGSVGNCQWGHALKRSPGINRESRVLYPCPVFLSSATCPSLLKKHYNGLNQIKPKSLVWPGRMGTKYHHRADNGLINQ